MPPSLFGCKTSPPCLPLVIMAAQLVTHCNRSTPRLTVSEILETLSSRVPYVNYSVDHFNFMDSCLELLRLVFPEWFGSNANGDPTHNIQLVQCTEGITNKRSRLNYKIFHRLTLN